MNGIIIINKPKNITSAKAVALIKKTLKAEKVGHAGTLDPFAEGVLICCVNLATRLARFLLHGKKTYVAVIKLGEETDTQDLTGTILSTGRPVELAEGTIQNAFKSFEGIIEQLPPVYSALKHKGVPLYRLARRGKPVQKPPRRAHIYHIDILDIALPFIRFEVSCSAGTYIRTLCADIGKLLGCGGHLHALIRTESSGFTLRQAISLTELQEFAQSGRLSERMIRMSEALADMPEFTANASLIENIRHGKPMTGKDLIAGWETKKNHIPNSYIKILDLEGDLVAILNHTGRGHRLDYCCVFPKQDT